MLVGHVAAIGIFCCATFGVLYAVVMTTLQEGCGDFGGGVAEAVYQEVVWIGSISYKKMDNMFCYL